MTSIPQTMQEHLQRDATTLATCWILKPKTGPKMGFTDHDRSLTLGAVACEPASGLIGSEARQSAGFDADDQEISGALMSETLTAGDLLSGKFDGAIVETWRVNWQQPDQAILLRSGYLGEIRRHDTGFSAEVRGFSSAMEQKQGRLYQYACDARLGDRRCGLQLDQAGYAFEALVERKLSPTEMELSFPDDVVHGMLALGRLQNQPGETAEIRLDILSHSLMAGVHHIETWLPYPSEITEGQSLIAYVGCDKQFHTCKKRFGNELNFRGFPHIPGNDFVLSYPRAGENHDGRALVSGSDR